MRKIIIFALVILFFLESAAAKSYLLENADITVLVNKDGSLSITEKILFEFDGCFSEVYRNIPILSGESIRNFQMNSSKPFVFEFKVESNEIKGKLIFSNKICNTTEEVTISYTFLYVTKVYNDISELHLKLWGSDWKELKNLNAEIVFPKTSEINYWIHPFYGINLISNKVNNKIILNSKNLPENQWLEIRVIFPNDFLENPIYPKTFNENAKERITTEENDFKNNNLIMFYLEYLSFLLPILPILFFLISYLKYGREPKIDYKGIYERELPSNHEPALVNAILSYNLNGKPNINGFIATIFDLVRKKFLEIKEVNKDILIQIKDKKGNLKNFEKDILNFLKKHSIKNELYWSGFKKEISIKQNEFLGFFINWRAKVKEHFKINDYYESKGLKIVHLSFYLVMMFSSVVWLLKIKEIYPAINFHPINCIIAFIVSLFLLIIPPIIPARRTKEGAVFYYKWMAFKKYLTDFSYLKEHPPESIKLWEEYLVYAVALGVASKVIKSMKLMVSEKEARSSNLVFIYHNPAFIGSFNTAFSSSAGGSVGGGGGGGFGGGSGGGGGGAR